MQEGVPAYGSGTRSQKTNPSLHPERGRHFPPPDVVEEGGVGKPARAGASAEP